MKTALFTAYDEKYAPLARLTVPLMKRYAAIAGIDFKVSTTPSTLNIYWNKFTDGIRLLREGYERILYLDVDQMVTNDFATPWADLPKSGFHVSKDWGHDAVEPWHFSVCGFVAYADAIPLFECAIELEPGHRGKPFPEQEPMRQVVKLWQRGQLITPGDVVEGRIIERSDWITVQPRKVFNCVPEQVCPGQVPEPWTPRDWCAHLTMVPIEERIRIFDELATLHSR